ncbi:MAG: Fic family protein [Treponema sp.]|jgi:cell filamentation protein|nr:Fic family protein [Treponema sp.]
MNDYTYIDPDYTYSNPKTGILRNKENVERGDLLLAFESFKCSQRLEELRKKPIHIKDSTSLLDIHRHLFQDVYAWAGKRRTVEISKDGKQFFPVSHFDTAFVYIDNLVSEYNAINKKDKAGLAAKLAEILDRVNYLHPFREGNGRTQREFIRTLALEKGYTLNLNPPDNQEVYSRYMTGTIESDAEKLTALIFELLVDYPK